MTWRERADMRSYVARWQGRDEQSSVAPEMRSRPLEKNDYDLIVQVIDRWWGGPTSALAHPIFFYELGEMARIVEDNGIVVGFLLGFIAKSSRDGDIGYVHLVGIHPDHRRRGVARLLYEVFEQDCRKADVARMKAITTLGNEGSQLFHQVMGWDMVEVEDYAGPGRPRIVFTKQFDKANTGKKN